MLHNAYEFNLPKRESKGEQIFNPDISLKEPVPSVRVHSFEHHLSDSF